MQGNSENPTRAPPNSLYHNKILRVIDICSNYLIGKISGFHCFYTLEVLALRSNQFSGFIPFTLLTWDYSVLIELDLIRNNILGPLGMMTSTTLIIHNVSSNSLSSIFPTSTWSCEIMDLRINKFSGNLIVMWSWGMLWKLLT